MKLEDKFKIALKKLNYNFINLKFAPQQFQEFLDSVPDFFLQRQGTQAANDEAMKIITNLPKNMSHDNKFIFGITYEHMMIGFFEILLDFPSQEILLQESQIIKEKIGNIVAKRFTIVFLVMLTEYRNRGIGSKIMSTIEEILHNEGYLYSHLIVNKNNVNAKRFYEKQGYHGKGVKYTLDPLEF